MKILTVYILQILLLGLLSGCASSKDGVAISVWHKGLLNSTEHSTIEFGRFSGNGGEEFGSLLKDKLSSNGQYDVYLSKDVKSNAHVLIQGELNTDFVEQNVPPEDTTCYREKSGKEYPCKWYYRKGYAVVKGNVEVFNKREGNLLRHFDLAGECPEQKTSELKRRPPKFDKRKFISLCLRDNVNSIYNLLVGWAEQRTLPFEKNDNLPEMNQVITGLELDASDIGAAVKEFCLIIEEAEKSKQVSRQDLIDAYWNLGLAYEYSGQFENASTIFAELFRAAPPTSSWMFWKKGNKFKEEYNKVKGFKSGINDRARSDQKMCTDLKALKNEI